MKKSISAISAIVTLTFLFFSTFVNAIEVKSKKKTVFKPTLVVSPTEIVERTWTTGTSVNISGPIYTLLNIGSSPLAFQSVVYENWLHTSVTTGSISAGGSTTVAVSFDPEDVSSLPVGDHSAVVHFRNKTKNTTQPEIVTTIILHVTNPQPPPPATPPPGISVTPADGFNSSGNIGGPFTPASKTYTITRTETGNVSWKVCKNGAYGPPSWLSLSASGITEDANGCLSGAFSGGTTPSKTITVSLVPANISGQSLDPGQTANLVGEISFTNLTNVIGNATRPVSVAATAPTQAGPLEVTPKLISKFLGNVNGPIFPASASFTLSNPGTALMAWNASASANWVNLSPTSGTILAGQTATIMVTINAANLTTSGNYNATLTFDNTTNGSGSTTISAAITLSSGYVYAWGSNTTYHYLGTGSSEYQVLTPEPVIGLPSDHNAVKVCAGNTHTLALLDNGEVWAWGGNNYYQLGNTGGNSSTPAKVEGLANVKDISCGYDHSLALLQDGTVRAWGWNDNGQLGDGSSGYPPKATPVQVTGATNIVAISAGELHSVFLKSNGNPYYCGYMGSIGLSYYNMNYAVPMVMQSAYPNPPLPTPPLVISLSAGEEHTLALFSTGEVWYGGRDYFVPYASFTNNIISGLTNVTGISAGSNHSVVLLSDGTIKAWGLNNLGQLGDGTITDRPSPVSVTGLSGANFSSAGGSHSASIIPNNTKAWGENSKGQLGDGTTNQQLTPVDVINLPVIVQLSAGPNHTVALE